MCITLTAFGVFNRQKMFYHFLNMAAIFTHCKVISTSIIFHFMFLGLQQM